MTSRYVPPHTRNRRGNDTVPNKQDIPSPDSFPALLSGSTVVRTDAPSWSKGKSFASLAREWKDQTEEEKQQRELQMEIENAQRMRDEAAARNHFTFQHHEDEDSIYDINENQAEQIKQAADEWTLVDRTKIVRELTNEERMERDMAREEEERLLNERNESVWKTEEWGYGERRGHT